MTVLKANMRMYSVTPAVAGLWSRLAKAVSERAGIPLSMLDHPPPRAMENLWRRDDLGLVQMCGWPFWRSDPRPHVIGAPVPDEPSADGAAVYWTDMIVAASSPATTIEETFGGRIAWTASGSQSGYNAPLRLFAELLSVGEPLPYERTVGPVVTPAGAIEAVLSGKADIAPLDSYYHLLLRRYDPAQASMIRSVAKTPPAPIPLLIASPGVAPEIAQRLRDALLSLGTDEESSTLLAGLVIRQFRCPEAESYRVTQDWAEGAARRRLTLG